MSIEPIETAKSSDLRLSYTALLRAAERAREIAIQTGTPLVVSKNGEGCPVNPKRESQNPPVAGANHH